MCFDRVISHLKQGQVSVVEVIVIHPMGVVDVHAGDFRISITCRDKRKKKKKKGGSKARKRTTTAKTDGARNVAAQRGGHCYHRHRDLEGVGRHTYSLLITDRQTDRHTHAV